MRTINLRVTGGDVTPFQMVLDVTPINADITVTATRATVEEATQSAQIVEVRERDELLSRPLTTIGAALADAPGVMVQETTAGQVSPHLRGLTGYQTLVLIDGIRYNTSIFRSGPNQYLALVDPSQAQSVEAVLGPAAAAYGSDSLGGTINVLTRRADFQARRAVHGELSLFGATADLSTGANAQLLVGGDRIAWIAGAAWRKHQDMRAGEGADSHNVFRRYFGLSTVQVRQLLGDRLQDTGFSQVGAHSKLAWRPAPDQSVTLWYQRGEQFGVRSYRDLLGGLGRLQAAFEPQTLDFFYARYENFTLGALDSLGVTFSLNGQRDDTVRQGPLITDTVVKDRNRVNAFGYSAQAATHVGAHHLQVFGGEVYDERISSRRTEEDPRTGQGVERRALYPNGARYTTYALFAQNTSEVWRGKLRVIFGGRLTGVRLRTSAARNRDRQGRDLGVVDSTHSFRDFTYHGSVTWRVNGYLGLSATIGRGFRAPNLNDLGAVGLTGLGFEVPAAAAIPFGALLAADAGEGALSTGRRIAPLGPETLVNYEFGAWARTRRFYGRAHLFDAEMRDPIVRRTLLFPADQVPATLAGVPVIPLPPTDAQSRQGVITVATASDPRAVKVFVNDGKSRYYGAEAIARYVISPHWSAEANYSHLIGRDLNPNRPARRLPPPQANAGMQYARGRWWVDLSGTYTVPQRRLSAADLDDERIGASRRRSDIGSFFRSSVVRSYLSAGPDARFGSPDDIFTPTNEVLSQIQDRVLPVGAVINGVRIVGETTRAPLLRQTDGWFAVNVRGGIALGEHWSLRLGVMNILDRNYRVHGSGIDSMGVNGFVGLRFAF